MLGILNGQVYDPLNGVNGEIQDIWVKDGRIVPPGEIDRERAEIIDAAGLVVMPGGVDIHSHIAGSKVNAGRKFRPEDHRADVRPRRTLPSPLEGGLRGSPAPAWARPCPLPSSLATGTWKWGTRR